MKTNECFEASWIASQHIPFEYHQINWDYLEVCGEMIDMQQNPHQVEDEVGQAIIQERERLARELHDTVVPEVYTIGLFLEALELAFKAGKREKVTKGLTDLRAVTRETLAGLRLVLYDLSHSVLEEAGLVEALRLWLGLVETRFGINVELNVEGDQLLSDDVEKALYRITQEFVNNILKHAKAQNVFVELHISDHLTRLSVKDDGSGFDLSEVNSTSGFGLRNMQERAAGNHASLEIDTAPGKGTSICVIVARRDR